ncbi:MAG: flavin reductase family protein [Catonella sp.]
MNKISWKAGNMLYPLPAVMVSLTDKEGNSNIITLAWAGTICTNPPMLSVSIRPERYSYNIIKETGEFVVNLTTKELAYATDYCGVKSGKDVDKFGKMRLTKLASEKIKAVAIAESPVNIECKVRQIMELGSHSLFIADVVNVRVDSRYLDEKGRFNLAKSELIAYSHGRYYELGKELGTFGYSIKKSEETTKKVKKN